MAQVTYRGVSYDTDARKAQVKEARKVTETYRGVKFSKDLATV